ncbi:MAG TPA: 50S ribosomal protein L9 [Candidatus Omnitrophota bacterium]|nr:50S ribosomal protein L9 [Candidatus Omnitrophota bacterium]HQJ15457.1 50S ribosomal protein L9 [Candidatus Omnitrophota bacterium]
MNVILKKDIEGIGRAGTVVKVKDGYARNFLFPRSLALESTQANLKRLEQEQKARSIQTEKLKKSALEIKARIEKLSLTLPVLVQEKEKLYGSITAVEIAKALQEEGIEVDKNMIVLEEPLKALGIFEVPVKLHSEVTATIKLWIVKK